MRDNRISSVTQVGSLFVVMLILLSGCAITKDIQASRNRDLLGSLRIGMSQGEVVQHMGKPWKTEAFLKSEKVYTMLYYVTQRIPDGTTTDEEMTPVVFREGVLVGWGRRFFSDLRIEMKQAEDN